jgi:hypothetical protein
VCLCLCFTARIKTFPISYYICNNFLIYIFLEKPFCINYIIGSVTLYYFVVLLKQTAKLKTLPFTTSHNFKTVSQPCLGQSFAGFSTQRPVFGHRSFHFAFAIQNTGTRAWFPPGIFILFCQHPYTSATYLHFDQL